MTLLGLIRIPRLEGFEKAFMAENRSVGDKLWAVLIGGVFQVLRHENIHQAMYTPDGMLALFMFSLPLMVLGALALFARWTDGRRAAREKAAARAMARGDVRGDAGGAGDVRQRRHAEHERHDRAV